MSTPPPLRAPHHDICVCYPSVLQVLDERRLDLVKASLLSRRRRRRRRRRPPPPPPSSRAETSR